LTRNFVNIGTALLQYQVATMKQWCGTVKMEAADVLRQAANYICGTSSQHVLASFLSGWSCQHIGGKASKLGSTRAQWYEQCLQTLL
jgi:hypothetical protein